MSYPNGPSPEDPYSQQGDPSGQPGRPSGGYPAHDQGGGYPPPPPPPGQPGYGQSGPQQPGYDQGGYGQGGYPPPPGYDQGGYAQQGQYGGYAPHPGMPGSSATTGQPNQDERTMALLSHLSGILLWFIGPLIFFLIKKDESPFVRDQAAQALNFQLLLLIGYLISAVLYIIFIGAILQLAVWVCAVVFGILGGIAANKGEWYRYPFNVSWVK
ncbi:DUF4870 domain-containing protein [Nocardiopsis listeri]|uniref:DUF4870 domain-containing protein n=1 Tax=Nocardiopsis listeri TaxID=53440 RepID=UPI000831D8FA|nr:DUF4870 domain-containing protein [Nocardiopsis listeri]